MDYPGSSRDHLLDAVSTDGEIRLEDGSCWAVYTGFHAVINAWCAGEMIGISPNRDPDYPYRLVNVHQNQSVEARYLGGASV